MKKYILAILLMLCTNAYTFGQSKQHCHVDFIYPVKDVLIAKKEPTYASFSENSICFSELDNDSYVNMRRIEIEDTATIRHYWDIISKLFIDKTVKVVNCKPRCVSSKSPLMKICVYGDNYSREEYEYKINLCCYNYESVRRLSIRFVPEYIRRNRFLSDRL